MKDERDIIITNACQTNLDVSNRAPSKIWVDKRSKYYNRSMKSWMQGNYIEIYLSYNEGKFIVAERFIKTLKNRIKQMTSISKNVYMDKVNDIVDDIVDKYNNACHRTTKMKAYCC